MRGQLSPAKGRRRRAVLVTLAALIMLALSAAPGISQTPGAFELVVSTSSNRANPVLLEGQSTSGNIYVFSRPTTNVAQVRFWLDDPTMAGAPRMTETRAPHDLAGTKSDGTATPFNTKGIANGEHTITAAITPTSGAVVVIHADFTVQNGKTCGPLPCSQALVRELPYDLEWSDDHGKILDRNGVGTGFTYLDQPSFGTGYVQSNLAVDRAAGKLLVTSTKGLAVGGTNTQDNALGIGIDAPSQKTRISTTIINPPKGTGKYQQAGIWFGNDEDNYDKLDIISSGSGLKIEHLLEVGGSSATSKITGLLNLEGAAVTLSLVADPTTRQLSATYRVGAGQEVALGTFTAPGEFFSFDAAGIDPAIGTRSFGGIYASHRNGPTPLTYTFDRFSVTDASTPPPAGPPPDVTFNRATFSVNSPTSLAWGPDGRLYVLELFGKIHALQLGAAGQVISDEVINTLGTRLALGLEVDPQSTPGNVILWASHSSPSLDNGVPNSGMVTKLSGPGFATRSDVITGLPRAKANHATNSIHFGPDGKLYLAQGGNTGAGAPNNANTEFGTMQEQPLSAAILSADVRSAAFDGSCANTTDIFGPAPCDVQVYASGLRNTYDFVWHSNGLLYGPNNGLGVTGSFPPSPTAPCKGTASTTSWTSGGQNPGDQPDGLNLLEQGKYYGHPNPYRNECVFRDGRYQNVAAPANYKDAIYNLGANRSANGTIEYKAPAFCGDLRGDLLIANYSVGDDLTRIELAADGRSVANATSLIGGFNDPLPVTQSPDGRIFVGELGASRVTVLDPVNIGCWTPRPAAPAQILDAGGTALDGKVYVVAGKTETAHRTNVHVFDPASGAWSNVANLPGPGVENAAVTSFNGKLYAFGGATQPFSGAVGNSAVFDPATGAWTTLAPMPTPRSGAGAAVVDGKIYVAGGMDASGASVATVEVFNPATGTWSTAPAMASRRDNPGVASADGKLYVFGGRIRNSNGSTPNPTLNSVEMFDPVAGTWAARAPMPTGRRTMVVGRIAGKMQLMGGEVRTDGGTFPQNEEYDPATNTWRILRTMTVGRHGAAAGTVNDVVYVIGGGIVGGGSYTNIHESFSLQG